MSDTIEDQIRLGLRLVAEEVQPPAGTRAAFPPSLRLVAFAVVLVGVAAAIPLGLVSRGQGPSARFLTDRFDYRPGGGFAGAGGPLSQYSVNCCSALTALSARDAWTVGSGVAWHWNGSAWRIVPLPALRGEVELRSVTSVDDGEAWAVGDRSNPKDDRIAHALVEHWDGARWSVVRLPRTGVSSLFSVSASGPDDVWAVGMRFGRDARGTVSDSLITRDLLLHWDGSSWSEVAVPWVLRPDDGPKVVATGLDDVWVWSLAGEQIEHWDGENWKAVPAPFGPHDPVWGLSATSPDDAWAVGSYVRGQRSRTLAAHWNGEAWQIAPTPNRSTDSRLEDVAAGGPDDVWAIGQSEWRNANGNGRGPFTLFEHWDGRSWKIMPGAVPPVLDGSPSLAATQDGAAWAIGSCWADSFLDHWNGSAWTMAKHPPDQHWDRGASRRIRRLGFGHCRPFRS